MIINPNLSTDVERLGDIESNSVSIDEANLDFIITILSSNFYSSPRESFIREIVSNAWDSHIEAGIKEPVLVHLGKNSQNQAFCKIQDFGVGVSPERFDKIFRNIGSSTKRSDNLQIGGFGMGRFSALAYTNSVNLISRYEGKEYHYLMYKDGMKINIDLLHTQDTTERNGFTVLVYLESDQEALKIVTSIYSQLLFFNNLYLKIDAPLREFLKRERPNSYTYSPRYQSSIFNEDFNKVKPIYFGNFNIHPLQTVRKVAQVLLGKVVYPLDHSQIDQKYKSFLLNTPCYLKFNIGELDITPQREDLIYTKRTIQAIELKIELAQKEVQALLDERYKDGYQDFETFFRERPWATNTFLFASKPVEIGFNYKSAGFSGPKNFKYKGHLFGTINLSYAVQSIFNAPLSTTCKMAFQYSKVLSHEDPLRFRNAELGKNVSLYTIPPYKTLKKVTKAYMREAPDKEGTQIYYIQDSVPNIYRRALKLYIDKRARNSGPYSIKDFKGREQEGFRALFFDMIKHTQSISTPFDNSSVPKSFIDAKGAKKATHKKKQKRNAEFWQTYINLYVLRASKTGPINKPVVSKETIKLSELQKDLKSLVVYSERNNDKLKEFYKLFYGVKANVVFAEVPPSKHKLVENLNTFVHVDNFIDVKYKVIRDVGTFLHLEDKYGINTLRFYREYDGIKALNVSLDKKLLSWASYYDNFYKAYETNDKILLGNEILKVCRDSKRFNFDMLSTFNACHKYEEALKKLYFASSRPSTFLSYRYPSIEEQKVPMLIDYVLARKLFIPNLECLDYKEKLKKQYNEIN